MPDRSLVSCIVPVFNGERYVCEALASILAQTYRPLEIIVVDDGSTDDTPATVARFADRVVYVRQAHAGPAAARNRGLAASKGEFVAFLDADDLWHSEKLTRQMARFAAQPGLELCITHVRKFWIPELEHEKERLLAHPSTQEQPGYVCQCLVARRSVFDKIGTFDVSLSIGEDTDWFLRAADQGLTIEVLPHLLVYRRMHQDNLSYRVHDPAGTEDRFRIVLAAFARRRKRDGSEPESNAAC
jgi:glycosyltransferase involved in cell wall biosynthesis